MPLRAKPLIGPAPRSAMFFPLVVLVAVLPGLVALNSWDLTPPGPLWGLRALSVLDGLAIDQVPAGSEIKPFGESTALRAVSFQPLMPQWWCPAKNATMCLLSAKSLPNGSRLALSLMYQPTSGCVFS